jgi:hypothetical protein
VEDTALLVANHLTRGISQTSVSRNQLFLTKPLRITSPHPHHDSDVCVERQSLQHRVLHLLNVSRRRKKWIMGMDLGTEQTITSQYLQKRHPKVGLDGCAEHLSLPVD